MLSTIREKIKGHIAYFVIGLIVISFVLFGVGEHFVNTGNTVVANVGEEEISKEEFLLEFNAKKKRLQQELAGKYIAEFDSALKKSTLELMIDRRLLGQLSDRLGYTTTPSELLKFIKSSSAFKENGKFSLNKYKRLLRLNNYSISEYEIAQLDELTRNQVESNFLNSAFITPLELKRMQTLIDQQRQFSYISFDAGDYVDKVAVDEKSIQDFYNNQKQTFFDPKKVKVSFIELSFKQVAKNIKVNDDDLFDFYENEKERYSTQEERQAQHILLKSEKQANKIVEQINQGKDFAKLAAKYSQDSVSKDQGGDLGFFTTGMMVPEFEAQVFKMKEGEVSKPIKTDFGYHIIKLNKIKAQSTQSFEAIRNKLIQRYTEQITQKSFYASIEQLTNLAYGVDLEEISQKMNLKLKTSEFFTQNTQKYNPKFVAAAYSDLVLNKGENSEITELSKDRFIVLRLDEKVNKKQKVFDEVKVEIKAHLINLLAKTFVDDIAKKIANLLTDGDLKAAKKIIDKNQLKWKDVGWVTRDSKLNNIRVISRIFSLPKPNNGAIYDSYNLNEQKVVLLKLSAIREPQNVPDVALLTTLIDFQHSEMLQAILTTLRKNTDIKISMDNM